MAYIVEFNTNDELINVIQKCNRNFKAVMDQISYKVASGNQTSSEEIAAAVASMQHELSNEATTRFNKDQDLQGQIDGISASIPTKQEVLTYIHSNLWTLVQDGTDPDLMTKIDTAAYSDLVVSCSAETTPFYIPIQLIPQSTNYESYAINGKAFRMKIDPTDNKLWINVIDVGTWDIYMR